MLGALNQGVLVGRLSRVVAPARLAVAGALLLALSLGNGVLNVSLSTLVSTGASADK